MNLELLCFPIAKNSLLLLHCDSNVLEPRLGLNFSSIYTFLSYSFDVKRSNLDRIRTELIIGLVLYILANTNRMI